MLKKQDFCQKFSVTLRPKKSFGQNFLINESVSQRITAAILEHRKGDRILEVGPGKGALTKYLVEEKNIHFKAVEADWDMVHHLQQTHALDHDQLIQQDFLKLPLEKVFDREEYNIVGNFPYNISSQILFRIEKYRDCVPVVIGMFQKEVAERIASGPGSKVYGVISVLLQASYEPSILFKVQPGSFYPAPKVTSAILLLKRKRDYEIPCDRKLFRAVVKNSFNQRRKMLRNTLKSFIKEDHLFELEVMKERPEQLSLDDFIELTNLIDNQKL